MENAILIIISACAGVLTLALFVYVLDMLLHIIRRHKEEMNKILSKVEEPLFKYETTKITKKSALKEQWEKDVSNDINRMTVMLHNDED